MEKWKKIYYVYNAYAIYSPKIGCPYLKSAVLIL